MKTDMTKQIEHALWVKNRKMGTFGCFEVSIGFNGDYRGGVERVDFITYNTKGEVYCYEIKVSKSDFNSSAKKTFIGDFNYYVIPQTLWDELSKDKDFRRNLYDVGVYTIHDNRSLGLTCVKPAKRKQVSVGMKVTVMESMVRSLNREVSKLYVINPIWECNEEDAQ